ncbi:hypothetical protein [Actinoplanes sp. URMC 104]|uniref:hypothetical protein n=1 Tax=Actinoplanes sp. URMC 104 TaxID=3423409 RepID=UPI003F1BE3A9
MQAPVSGRRKEPGRAGENDRIIRILLAAFALLAVVTTVSLGVDSGRGPIGDTGLVFYPPAAVGHAILAHYYGRPWARPVLVVTESILVPLQFVLSIPSNLPLLGMLLSGMIAVLLKPRFPQLSPRSRKLFLWLHVGLSVSWLGLSMAMLVLSLVGQFTDDRVLGHDAYRIMHLFDLVIVIPMVFLAIVSGLVVSLGTKWGLIRNKWVLTKLILSLAIPSVAGFQHHWISRLTERTADGATTDPGGLAPVLTLCMAGYAVILWTATALSVWKPWGKTRWGRRAIEARRGRPGGAAPSAGDTAALRAVAEGPAV